MWICSFVQYDLNTKKSPTYTSFLIYLLYSYSKTIIYMVFQFSQLERLEERVNREIYAQPSKDDNLLCLSAN